MLWNYTVKEMAQGFAEEADFYCCTLCGERFEKGKIYEEADGLCDAYGAVRRHIRSRHKSTADYLLSQDPALIGVSEVQKRVLQLMAEGMDDKQIAQVGQVALSTVRNHRFKLREKEKQARLYLALMESLEQKLKRPVEDSDQGALEEVHAAATMLDDRYCITAAERDKTLQTYFDENGALRQFPAREKKKIIVLREIMKNFKPDRAYSEAEVNRTLKRIYEADYPTIRRYLIEYGFMERSKDCSVYRVKE